MSQGPYYKIAPPVLELSGNTGIVADIECEQCSRKTRIYDAVTMEYEGWKGLKCSGCERAYFLVKCTGHNWIVSVDDRQMHAMHDYEPVKCPEAACDGYLIWSKHPDTC